MLPAAGDVGGLLWAAWGEVIAGAGMGRVAFDAIVDGYRRELWLWVIGERQWEPTIAGLAGRLVRRMPAPA